MSRDDPSVDDRFDRLMEEALRSSALAFASSHPTLFFRLQRVVTSVQPQFNTDLPPVRQESLRGNGKDNDAREVSIVAVQKLPRGPNPGRISIGRARGCDIVIRDSSISKLHAYIVVLEDGSHAIVDVGSHNGTVIGSSVLTPHVASQLKPGDLVILGAVAALTLDAAGAHDALLKLAGESSPRS